MRGRKSAVAQVPDQRADRRIVQRTGLDAPVDRKRDQQDRIAERVFLGTGSSPRGQLQEFLGKRPCPMKGASGTALFCGGLCDAASGPSPGNRMNG